MQEMVEKIQRKTIITPRIDVT